MSTGSSDKSFPAHGTDAISIQHAFDAMRFFLEAFWQRDGKPPDSLAKLLSWTSSSVWDDGGPADPAMWSDWLDALDTTRK